MRNTDEEEEDETRKIKKEVRKFGFWGRRGPPPRGVGSDPAECAGVGPERFYNRDETEI
jgi:hypothetical protein